MAERAIYDEALEKDENKAALDSLTNNTPAAVYEKPNFVSDSQEETSYKLLAISASTKCRRQDAYEPRDGVNVDNAVSIAVSPNYASSINHQGQGQGQGQDQALSESVLYEAGSLQTSAYLAQVQLAGRTPKITHTNKKRIPLKVLLPLTGVLALVGLAALRFTLLRLVTLSELDDDQEDQMMSDDNHNQTAIAAVRSTEFNPSQSNIVTFDRTTINVGFVFDSMSFSLKKSGVYWLMVSANVKTNRQLSLTLATHGKRLQEKYFIPQNDYVVSLDDLRYFEENSAISVTSDFAVNTSPDSSAGQEGSVLFCGFKVDTIFQPFHGISVDVNRSVVSRTVYNDQHIVSTVASVQRSDRLLLIEAFSVEKYGIYIVSANWVVHTAHLLLHFMCFVGMRPITPYLPHVTQGSAVFLVELQSGESVNCDGFYNTNYKAETPVSFSIRMILYEPKSVPKLAWALMHVLLIIDDGSTLKVPDDSVAHINVGNVYNETSKTVQISSSGLYFMALTVQATLETENVIAVLLNNYQAIVEIIYKPYTFNATQWISMHKSSLVRLKHGDTLVCAKNKQSTERTKQPHTYWIGLLLYSD